MLNIIPLIIITISRYKKIQYRYYLLKVHAIGDRILSKTDDPMDNIDAMRVKLPDQSKLNKNKQTNEKKG